MIPLDRLDASVAMLTRMAGITTMPDQTRELLLACIGVIALDLVDVRKAALPPVFGKSEFRFSDEQAARIEAKKFNGTEIFKVLAPGMVNVDGFTEALRHPSAQIADKMLVKAAADVGQGAQLDKIVTLLEVIAKQGDQAAPHSAALVAEIATLNAEVRSIRNDHAAQVADFIVR